MSDVKTKLRSILGTLDEAIELGLTAAYPTVFNLPAPEGGVQWKEKVKLGAKLVKNAAKDILVAVVDEWVEPENKK
jgi:hypothetical protein